MTVKSSPAEEALSSIRLMKMQKAKALGGALLRGPMAPFSRGRQPCPQRPSGACPGPRSVGVCAVPRDPHQPHKPQPLSEPVFSSVVCTLPASGALEAGTRSPGQGRESALLARPERPPPRQGSGAGSGH